MLYIHQVGSLKVGEVVRYTVTYTPAHDRILPPPEKLHVKIRNTSAIAFRAAYLHGPYALYAACYPASYDPWKKEADIEAHGVPQFEPNIKASGSWNAQLVVPPYIRETGVDVGKRGSRELHDDSEPPLAPSVTWIIEVSSQILFSTTATVHFEIIVGRDESSVDLGFANLGGAASAAPGHLSDFQHRRRKGQVVSQAKGVFSKAVRIVVDDATSLWNKPSITEERDSIEEPRASISSSNRLSAGSSQLDAATDTEHSAKPRKRRKKVHLVILTHGLHSNLEADMLYLKESIDAAAKQSRLDAKFDRAKRKAQARTSRLSKASADGNETGDQSQGAGGDDAVRNDSSDDEEVMVRGFAGNSARTERGIQYLGKRMAKYVLSYTYPDQPYLPIKRSVRQSISQTLSGSDLKHDAKQPAHSHSSIAKDTNPALESDLPYRITSISFIGHSLGGLIQTYAIAYIHKHSPEFFTRIKPINFIALASPFLGLSNENPLYVRFALDFGLVGRTGQDLGLTWRAPNIARSGWGAMVAGIGSEGQRRQRQPDPGAKPLLRILPSGPAHHVLRQFRNRTVYSNVVNDGIVPLRTSCLLFLDWRGLGRVEKARRENGLVGTMAGWGWAEITGANSTQVQKMFGRTFSTGEGEGEVATPDEDSDQNDGEGDKVPQPAQNATQEDSGVAEPESPEAARFLTKKDPRRFEDEDFDADKLKLAVENGKDNASAPTSPLAGFLNLFKGGGSPKTNHHHPTKDSRIYRRGQTLKIQAEAEVAEAAEAAGVMQKTPSPRPGMARGESALDDDAVFAPPKTTVFESAGDILNPPIPSLEYFMDPSTRARTIFHDRVYHPSDIPPPPLRKRSTLQRFRSSDDALSRQSTLSQVSQDSDGAGAGAGNAADPGTMKVEEKIARAYHRDLSWRKVLVRLEPDAHNNMIVRRMFSNAYGWPVVKHLVETHFTDSFTAVTADDEEPNTERARPMDEPTGAHGEEVAERPEDRDESESKKPQHRASLQVAGIHPRMGSGSGSGSRRGSSVERTARSPGRPPLMPVDSARWDDRFFESDDDDDDQDDFSPERSPAPPHRRSDHGLPVRSPRQEPSKETSGQKFPKQASFGQAIATPDPSEQAKSSADPRRQNTSNQQEASKKPHIELPPPKVAPTLVRSPAPLEVPDVRVASPETMDSSCGGSAAK